MEIYNSIADMIQSAPEEPDDLKLAALPRNDRGNAQRLIARHGRDLRYVLNAGWHVWNGRYWDREQGATEAMKRAHLTARAIEDEVQALADNNGQDSTISQLRRHATTSGNAGRTKAMLEMAEPYLTISPNEMDRQPHLFNCRNGTLELSLGNMVLRPPRREDYLTRMAEVDYDPVAAAPGFKKFLERIMPDIDLRIYLQSWLGYCLSGEISEQIIAMFHGIGANGKSTLVDTVARLMGNYAVGSQIQTFMHDDRRAGGQASPDLVRLMAVRFVFASEPEPGQRLSESTVKQITGGERIVARHLYGRDFIEFKPQFKLTLSINIRPPVRGQDEGIWRRLRLIPFSESIPPGERDRDLPTKLAQEGAGILNWLLDGYRIWREHGLVVPHAVKDATQEYRTENDPVGQFWNVALDYNSGAETSVQEIYNIYRAWCAATGLKPFTATAFGRRMVELGAIRKKSSVMYYLHIVVRPEIAHQYGGKAYEMA